MNTTTLILIGIVIGIAILGIVAMIFLRKHRTEGLRTRLGPEYDRVLQESGNRRQAEASLVERAKRVKRYDLQPLSPGDRARFTEFWSKVQARFVDDPKAALTETDDYLGDVMSKRGYPERLILNIARQNFVGPSRVVDNYRAAHEIALRPPSFAGAGHHRRLASGHDPLSDTFCGAGQRAGDGRRQSCVINPGYKKGAAGGTHSSSVDSAEREETIFFGGGRLGVSQIPGCLRIFSITLRSSMSGEPSKGSRYESIH